MITDIILLIVVILFSALFSGLEIAFVASNKLLMGIDMNNRTITSFAIDKFYSNSKNFVSSLLVGNNIVLVIYGILMAKLLNATILSGITDSTGVRLFLETLISTIIISLTGEFVPKAIFRINPNGALKRFALICLFKGRRTLLLCHQFCRNAWKKRFFGGYKQNYRIRKGQALEMRSS